MAKSLVTEYGMCYQVIITAIVDNTLKLLPFDRIDINFYIVYSFSLKMSTLFYIFSLNSLIYSVTFSIFSINIPYPFKGLLIITWVTAPISLPFCTIGLPDIP